MKEEDKIKMFNDVFAPKKGEKLLLIIDKPHNNIKDNEKWKDRREMAKEWYETLTNMGDNVGFTVDMFEFNAMGIHNTPFPKDLIDKISKYHLVIAMTEYSASAPLAGIAGEKGSITRVVSMPIVERRMENTAFKANYVDVQIYAENIKKMLTKAISADVLFSTGDKLFLDLRNRIGKADGGYCKKTGELINFPSGEGYIAPYEGIGEEIDQFGESKTEGFLPDNQHGPLIKYKVVKNIITEVIGDTKGADEMRKFFEKDPTHRNIAELGIGCNPEAVVTGNLLEDEKVSGLHIAYGTSVHTGGRTQSDIHIDICFPKGLPGAVKTLTLNNPDGSKVEIITDGNLRFDLLK
jgi:hypothetical protein